MTNSKKLLRMVNSKFICYSRHRDSSSSPQSDPLAVTDPAHLKPFNNIPGPLALPILRHSAHVLPRIGTFHHSVGLGLLNGLHERYGNLVRLAKATRSRPVLYIFDPELMSKVYESNATDPPRWHRSPLQQHRNNYTKCPVQGEQSDSWWNSIGYLLQDGQPLKNYKQAFEDIASDFVRRIGDLRYTANTLNEELETELYRWALETLAMMIYGIRIGCLDGAAHAITHEKRTQNKASVDDDTPHLCSLLQRQEEELTATECFVRCSREIADGNYLVRSEDTLRTDSDTFKSALQAFNLHMSLADHFLQRGLTTLNSPEKRAEQYLLKELQPLEYRLLPLITDIFLAGTEPLVQSSLSMLYQLSLHAYQQQKAHDEVNWATLSIEEGADAPELPYVTACVKELMRLYPATGGVVRRSKERLEIAGYDVPAGVDIVLAHGVTSKIEKEWGRANSFLPERWCDVEREPLRFTRAHPLASMPFGEQCPAAGIVGRMLTTLTSKILSKYRLEWHGPPPKFTTTGINKLQPPFYFVLKDAA